MSANKARPSRGVLAFIATAGAIAVTLAVQPAALADAGTVTQVEYNVSTHTVALQLNNVGTLNYLVPVSSPGGGCSWSADEIKEILTIAQAAFLSGKSVTLGTASCGTSNTYITDIAMH